MGYALAEAALDGEHEVTLISGPTAIAPPASVSFVAITTSDELLRAVHEHVRSCDMLIMCAAVADYRPLRVATRKLEKQDGTFSLELTATPDILASLPDERSYTVVGFAAQTHDLAANAQRKLRAKNCDVVVANDVSRSDSGIESDDNEVTIFFRNSEPETISRAPKKAIAREILKKILQNDQKSLTKKS
ncbi:hypothetical protein BH18VER1_BH18VER1_00550 [soil metagenome]